MSRARIYVDHRNRIQYYGSPVGYLREDHAVVDAMFQTGELMTFLGKQHFTIEWRDGVYDRLVLGEQEGVDATSYALKYCRIWQLRGDTSIEMRFIDYARFLSVFGEPKPDFYAAIFDGQVETNNLEELYDKFRSGELPPGYTGHPLSMSDVIELYDEAGSTFHYCDRFGFRQIAFGQ